MKSSQNAQGMPFPTIRTWDESRGDFPDVVMGMLRLGHPSDYIPRRRELLKWLRVSADALADSGQAYSRTQARGVIGKIESAMERNAMEEAIYWTLDLAHHWSCYSVLRVDRGGVVMSAGAARRAAADNAWKRKPGNKPGRKLMVPDDEIRKAIQSAGTAPGRWKMASEILGGRMKPDALRQWWKRNSGTIRP